MLHDKLLHKAYKEFDDKRWQYEYEKQKLEKKFKEEEKKFAEIEKIVLEEHAFLFRGQRLQNKNGEVWQLLNHYIEWFFHNGEFRIEYYCKLEGAAKRYGTFSHEELKEGFEKGYWAIATDKDKPLPRTINLAKVIKHESDHRNYNKYIGMTKKNKCFLFESWNKELDKTHHTNKLKIVRDSLGEYKLKGHYRGIAYIKILAVYENHRELATDFLL